MLHPPREGWFVLNAHDARWRERDGLGFYTSFESAGARFGDDKPVLCPDAFPFE